MTWTAAAVQAVQVNVCWSCSFRYREGLIPPLLRERKHNANGQRLDRISIR